MSDTVMSFLFTSLEVTAALMIIALGLLILLVIVVYIRDVTQTRHTIRRNYPVIGRFRYVFEYMGEFLRQYFFAMDREEMPFNRTERSWVYRAAKNVDTTVAFGSTRNLSSPGTVFFVNCPFPTLSKDSEQPSTIVIGAGCEHPYSTSALFNISAMSYGALSKPAVRALSHGARLAGCWLNTGEGGLSPYHLEGGCDVVFQIGTAKYGVRDADGNLDEDKLRKIAAYPQVKMFELKLSQGAKPGKGGILPGAKVTEEVAAIRGISLGQDSFSPNRHPEIDNTDSLLDMIVRIRAITGKPTGLKTVIGGKLWIDELMGRIVQRGERFAPDFFTLDSADGGSGAAPLSLIDNMGLPLKESLPLLVDKLHEYGLRDRIKVIASGKLITPSDIAWALCMGADFINSARGFMFALGCVQSMQCNKNTCPTGITTHDEKLQKGLNPQDKMVRVANYATTMNYEVGVIAHSCGVAEPRQLRRHHARMVLDNSLSVPLNEIYPDVQPQPIKVV